MFNIDAIIDPKKAPKTSAWAIFTPKPIGKNRTVKNKVYIIVLIFECGTYRYQDLKVTKYLSDKKAKTVSIEVKANTI